MVTATGQGSTRLARQTCSHGSMCKCWTSIIPCTSNSGWVVRLNVGAKLGSVFFDTFADSPMFSDHVSNFFFGAGPHAALALTRELGNTDIALFGRADFATLVGQVQQNFSEAVFDANGNALGFGAT